MPEFNLLPAQREFTACPDGVSMDICCYQGGFGSGKTWIGSLLGILLARKYPGKVGVVAGKTWPLLRDTTLRQYLEHLEKMGFRHGEHYTHHKSKAQIVLHCYDNAEIWFKHLENVEKLKSINAAWIDIEEASMISESDFLLLLSRLRQDVPRLRMFMHTNPQSSKSWIYKYFAEGATVTQVSDPEYGDWEHSIKYVDDAKTICYRRIVAPTSQNRKNLPPGYIENMQHQYSEDYYLVNVLGQDGDYTTGLVCKNWSDLGNLQDVKYNSSLTLYLSCDFNIDPNCWVVAHRLAGGEYHFIDEICLENKTTIETAEEFYRRYGKHGRGVVVTGDASGKNRNTKAESALVNDFTIIRNRLSGLGMRDVTLDVMRANPAETTRVETWNNMLCNSMGVRRIKVNPKCKWLVWNMHNLRYHDGGNVIAEPSRRMIEQDASKTLKYTKHIFDAASYLVYRYDPITKDAPKRTGTEVVTVRYKANA